MTPEAAEHYREVDRKAKERRLKREEKDRAARERNLKREREVEEAQRAAAKVPAAFRGFRL